MNRRKFLESTAALAALSAGCVRLPARRFVRNRPGDPGWPQAGAWGDLNRQVGGRSIALHSPITECETAPESAACDELFRKLKNPYFIRDHAELTQTSGWVDAWTSKPSAFAVAALNAADVAAAVNFAQENKLRLVVKGAGHSYKGTSNCADSLLIWTRNMTDIVLDHAFVPEGCSGTQAPQPAVTLGAGAIWAEAYYAVSVRGGRYVQGGGCTTVGVAGLVQSGGFGSFSKKFGTAAAGLLEAEIVTADGVVRKANACQNADLFWGLKGGGGGSLGVITRLTLRTRELPKLFGAVFGMIRAKSDDAFRALIAKAMAFYHEQLCNEHWGEQLRFDPQNRMNISMVFQGLSRQDATNIWRPFIEWVASAPNDYSFEREFGAIDIPARDFWNPEVLRKTIPDAVRFDDRPDAPAGNFLWEGDQGQVGWVIHGYKSAWLPNSLLSHDGQTLLVDALFRASRYWSVSLHFNKGLAGAPPEEIAAARDTATNPAVLDAFALAIIATGEGPAFPGIAGREPHVEVGRDHAKQIENSMRELLKVVPQAGAYVSESDYFETSWQNAFWGANYPRLLAVKRKYDPEGLFFVHHGAGSEEWSSDGFTREARARPATL